MNKTYKKIALAMLASVAVAGTASAQILFQDPLTGSGSPTTLAGTTPPTTQGTTAWTGHAGSGANVFANGTWTGGLSSVGLLYALTNGNIYDLSADVTTNPSESQASFGYNVNGTNGARTNFIGMRFDESAGGVLSVYCINPTGGALSSAFTETNGKLADIVLNTTGGDGNWSASYYYNGNLLETLAIPSAAQSALQGPTASGVALASGNSGTGQFQNFTFQIDAAPEPSTYALLLAGLVGLVVFARRRSVV